MKKLLLSAVALAILAAPAYAQKGGGKDNEPLMLLDREKKEQAERADQEYQRMINRTRRDGETAARNDPWANMRAPASNDGKR